MPKNKDKTHIQGPFEVEYFRYENQKVSKEKVKCQIVLHR